MGIPLHQWQIWINLLCVLIKNILYQTNQSNINLLNLFSIKYSVQLMEELKKIGENSRLASFVITNIYSNTIIAELKVTI